MNRWLILADDLTGAADAAVAFARRGYDTRVTWQSPTSPESAVVHAINLASRAATASDAASGHADALRRWHRPEQTLFKKIDSTLRGQPAAEMAALAASLRARGHAAWGLLAPANPAMHRTVRGAHVFVHDAPLEASDTWAREHTYATANLETIATSAGLRAVTLPLATLRRRDAAVRAAFEAAAASARTVDTILICDAETDVDLATLVDVAQDVTPAFFVGTAGLANALANAMPDRSRQHPVMARASHGTLVAVGTLASVSRDAARHLSTRDDVALVHVTPAEFTDDATHAATTASRIRTGLERGETVVALLDAPEGVDGRPDPLLAAGFAHVLAPALNAMGALIVTGGDTASALLAECGVHAIALLDEIEPGIAVGVTEGAIAVPIVTKPGAFGDAGSLGRCLDALTTMRQLA